MYDDEAADDADDVRGTEGRPATAVLSRLKDVAEVGRLVLPRFGLGTPPSNEGREILRPLPWRCMGPGVSGAC